MDQIWAREAVLTALKRRRAAGEPPVALAELQPLVGMGVGDLHVAVGILVEEGKVAKDNEGALPVYALAPDDGPALGAPVAGDAAEPAGDGPSSPWSDRLASSAEALAASGADAGLQARPVSTAPRSMSMSAAAAQALHPDSLGALIMAGLLEAADAGVTFTFTVAP